MNETQHHIFGEKLYHVTYGFGMYDRAYHYERKKMNKIDIILFNGLKVRPRI